jgi:hypothetical protein
MSGAARQRGRGRRLRSTENNSSGEMEEEVAGEPTGAHTPPDDSHDTRTQADSDQQEAQEAQEAQETPLLEEHHAILMAQVKQKRMIAEVASMQQEIAGDTPTNYVAIEGTSLPYHKRHASSYSEPLLPKHIKLGEPPSFSGTSVKELQTYEVGWKNQFKAMPELAGDDYSSRIATAATYLKGVAAEAWARNKTTFTKWEDYIRFLRGVLADPATRKSDALLRLATKTQKDTQTVRDLLA